MWKPPGISSGRPERSSFWIEQNSFVFTRAMDSNPNSVNINPLAANTNEQCSRASEIVARTQAALTQTHHRLEQTRALLTRQRRRLLLLSLRDQRCFERALQQ